jgi:hypothetical protein
VTVIRSRRLVLASADCKSRSAKRKGDRTKLLSADIGSSTVFTFTPVMILLTPEGIKPLLAIERKPDPVECLPGEIEELDSASWPLEPSSPEPFDRLSAEICQRKAPRDGNMGEADRNRNGMHGTVTGVKCKRGRRLSERK